MTLAETWETEIKPMNKSCTPDNGNMRFAEALASIRSPDFLKSEKYQEQQYRADRCGVHPSLLAFETAFVKRLKELGVPVFCHCAKRTYAEQAAAYARGNSKIKKYGAHTVGGAVDIIHSTKAWEIPAKAWTAFGHIGKEIAAAQSLDLVWGGDWKFYDPAHWELRNWRDMIPD